MKKFAILLILTFTILAFTVQAQDLVYIIEKEYVTLTVNQDTTCTLVYNLTVRVEQGAIRRFVDIGMPNPAFQVKEAYEVETGASVAWEEYHDYPYKVRLKPSQPINAGEKRTFILIVELTEIVYKDETNPGNAGLMFTPSWFPVTVEDLRLTVVLPPGVKPEQVKNQPDYQNIFTIEDRTALYWERKNLASNAKLEVGVSFPQQYLTVEPPSPPTNGGGEGDWLDTIIGGGICCTILAIFILVPLSMFISKKPYKDPLIMIEALGPRKGLTAPEAALLIEEEKKQPDYSKILTMILYSLARKGAIKITSIEPLKIEKIPFQKRLRYYERRFLKCIKNDGTLNPDCLGKVILTIHKTLRQKMRGYNRKQTIEYYQKIVEKAWQQVKTAKTPELKLARLDKNMEWILLDPDYPTQIRTILIDPTPTLPPPTWTYITPTPTTQPVQPIPLTKIADQIATTIEKTAINLATTIEKTAQQITSTIEHDNAPPPRPTITSSCACVSCACACACVSCACACASGGAG